MNIRQALFPGLLIAWIVAGCGGSEADATLDTEIESVRQAEQIDGDNNPNDLVDYTEMLNGFLTQLPQQGAVSDYWLYPSYFLFLGEGIAAKSPGQSLSPTEKYDRAFRGDTQSTKWELQYHGTDGGRAHPEGWEGHCNGVAGAITVAPEPKKNVTMNGVEFTPYDIKALLSEAVYKGEAKFVGTRCSSASTLDEHGRATDDACRDMNAGAFHVAVTNILGLRRQMVVGDFSPGYMVWNYPIVGYRVASQRMIGAQEANRLVSSRAASEPSYVFNHAATSFAHVTMTITKVGLSEDTAAYEYVLELNSNGKIIGGEWIGQSRSEHPDFIWQLKKPESANPYIDFDNVKKLVRASR